MEMLPSKLSNTKFGIFFLIVALSVTTLSVGLNLLWFGMYEYLRDKFQLSYFQASVVFGIVVAMIAAIKFPTATEMNNHKQ